MGEKNESAPEDEKGREIARAFYRKAWREMAELIEEMRGADVGNHVDQFAGLWAACRMTESGAHGEPWDA